jgi:Ornithine/acetylornithine aminotransferase
VKLVGFIAMTKGTHGSTFGGNPLAISVGKVVLETILKQNFLNSVDLVARHLWNRLKQLEKKHEEILEIRGAGLLLGIKTKQKNSKVALEFKKNKLLSVTAADNIIRLAPPLVVTIEEVNTAIKIIDKTLDNIND